MKSIFTSKENARVHPNNIIVKSHNSATYGDKSLMTLGPKIWNALPEKSNLKRHVKRLRNTLIYGLDPNVDVTYANPFTIEYFIKLLL